MNAQEEEIGRDGAETSLPAFESLEQNGGPSGDITYDMPSPQFRPYGWRENVDDGYDSVDSMPALQSVSNWSDNDEMDNSSDEDSDEDESLSRRAMSLEDRTILLTAAHVVERDQSIEQTQGRHRVFTERVEEPVREEEDENVDSAPLLTDPSGEPARLEPPFVTDGRGRVVWTSPAEEDKSMEEQNGEPTSIPGAATGSGGLLSWFNALF